MFDQFKSADYYRSKEALGCDLQRLVEASKHYIPNTPENLEMFSQIGTIIGELFFEKVETKVNNDS